MQCTFVGLFDEKELVATAIIQELELEALNSFGNRDNCFKSQIRNFLFKNFSSKIFIWGNNMLSGQNAYAVSPQANEQKVVETLDLIAKNWNKKAHIKLIKDFNVTQKASTTFQNDFEFSTQPAMLFSIESNWKSEADYVNDLQKKYRDQFKRCRKKGAELISKELSVEDILSNQAKIHQLYLHVAQNAPINTFFLPENHFYEFKKQLGEDFILRGYYLGDELVGFTTVIRHRKELETYFLGYEESIQREKMLYLNMLYDIIACGIAQHFSSINFGRTALEIKSSIGAEPVELIGFMRHTNPLIHQNLSWIFPLLEPKIVWNQRSPFKFKPQTRQLGIPHLDASIKKKQGSRCQFAWSEFVSKHLACPCR